MRARLSAAVALVATAVVLTAPSASAAGPPAISDTWANGVGATVVDLHAEINPNGIPTLARVEYLTAAAYQANLSATPPTDGFSGALRSPTGSDLPLGSGSIPVGFSRHIIGLQIDTAYRYRVVATNTAITVGPVRSFRTQEATPSALLPDNRGWEMVSPVDKNGGEIQGFGGNFGGGVLQASADGSAVTYSSASSFAVAVGAPGASQYLSQRGASGWSTQNITVPTLAGAFGAKPDGVPYQLFSGDLARGLLIVPQRCETPPCPRGYALRQSANGTLAPPPEASDMVFAGSNPELTQVVLATQGNLYRFSGGATTAINLKPGDASPTPGATLAAQSGAVSGDGSRIYFQLEGNLYLRQGTQTFQVDQALGGGGSFETATGDGSIAFFTKAGHLYRYSAGGTPADLTPAGEVEGVLSISPDASYLYYLTPAGLFLRQGAITTKVADAADASNYPPATGTARVAANGTLAFLSGATLTETDAGNLTQAYLYVPGTATLTCASCNPSGARPLGPAAIPGAIANGAGPMATRAYKPRVLAASGSRLFFDSEDALVPTDTNGDSDVYEWEAQGVGTCLKPGGCVALISSGRATEGATFVDASADGSDAFFLTDESLVPTDPGAAFDLYDARVGGGFPPPEVSIACLGDSCQPIPGEPEDPSPGTNFYRGEANPPLSFSKAKKPKKHHKSKKGKHEKKKGHTKKKGGSK